MGTQVKILQISKEHINLFCGEHSRMKPPNLKESFMQYLL